MAKDVLVYEKSNKAMASSRSVAKKFSKAHDKVIRDIENIIEKGNRQNWRLEDYFLEQKYIAENGKEYKEYAMTEKGFALVAMGFTGDKAFQWKLLYVEAFETMRHSLLERQSIEWKEQRAIGKLSRKSETDVLKKLVEYAKSQGSQNADKLYMTYSSLVKKLLGYESRDSATVRQLTNLTIMEEMILNCVQEAMQADIHYKEIYQICKQKLNEFMILTYQNNKAIM